MMNRQPSSQQTSEQHMLNAAHHRLIRFRLNDSQLIPPGTRSYVRSAQPGAVHSISNWPKSAWWCRTLISFIGHRQSHIKPIRNQKKWNQQSALLYDLRLIYLLMPIVSTQITDQNLVKIFREFVQMAWNWTRFRAFLLPWQIYKICNHYRDFLLHSHFAQQIFGERVNWNSFFCYFFCCSPIIE